MAVFVIRAAQFDALAAARREDFVRVMMDALRARFEAAEAMGADALRALVEEGTAAAEGYGLYADDEIEPFLGCRVVYGGEFPLGEDDDWARELLDDDALDADDKARQLDAQLEALAHLTDDEGDDAGDA